MTVLIGHFARDVGCARIAHADQRKGTDISYLALTHLLSVPGLVVAFGGIQGAISRASSRSGGGS